MYIVDAYTLHNMWHDKKLREREKKKNNNNKGSDG